MQHVSCVQRKDVLLFHFFHFLKNPVVFSQIMERKVISWCLYVDNFSRLPEYLAGLRCNQRAARWYFPDWKLRLYVNGSLCVKEFVNEVAQFGSPEIELVPCRDGANPMVERFRVFLDDSVDVSIVRDLDGILSKQDACRVNAWLDDDQSNVLAYREHEMSYKAMGGGIGIKHRAVRGNDLAIRVVHTQGRGQDEPLLDRFLQRMKCRKSTTSFFTQIYHLIFHPTE
jgi:hypothetical protein